MAMVDALLPEFDHEMTTTRRVLERVPEDKFDWKPHAKSFSLGALMRTWRRFQPGANRRSHDRKATSPAASLPRRRRQRPR